MRLSEFDYDLPQERIALHPLQERDQSRLMRVERATAEISHHVFSNLDELLRPTDLLVLNNTRVFPARLLGQRGGLTSESFEKEGRPKAKIEVLLLRPLGNDVWEVLVKPGRKMRVGERVYFAGGRLEAEVLERSQLGMRKVRFYYSGDFDEIIDQSGHVPLPPYIHRPDEPQDKQRYQTIFAKKRGAVAAPTAGLHFTRSVFDRLSEKGIPWCEITLHLGLGTFQPVHSEQIEEHRMEKESFEISTEAAEAINFAKSKGGRIIAVGTTVARSLESAALIVQHSGDISAVRGETDLFIYPGFQFRLVDGLLTNFHLPRSTLLMLVSAFAGRDLILQAYRRAIEGNYRFYSYGDCMLIL
ncbi:MAG: tRNA preQ1(34) S-adenosylmethionine ribosyltransferase-isomerase QueA [Acidobacteria bacterium]|nr:MAG: tRNA preQ1(34) S-adenosylmethionine ribosyltransferase-isomerase QueA [Acidobacteriota bacterium]